ncbi:hypothetical protein MMC19_000586 [Ptychographa xylographoides]|nr:hypothetical protein [Ptychographa xylographoides]
MSAPISLDPVVASTLDAYTVKTSRSNEAEDASDSDTDSLFASLSDDPVFEAHRAARLQSLSTALNQHKTLLSSNHGKVTTMTDEKEVMEIVAATPHTLLHFYHPDFARCAVMDRHLERLAPVHVEVRFLRIQAGNAAWLCARLKIRVLPCLIGWVDGVERCRIVGFEGIGDGARTEDMEETLVRGGVLVRAKLSEVDAATGQEEDGKREGYLGWKHGKGRVRQKEEEDDNDDWD